jgi:hypothetical protein
VKQRATDGICFECERSPHRMAAHKQRPAIMQFAVKTPSPPARPPAAMQGSIGCLERLRDRLLAGEANLLEVPMIGAAAAAKHIDVMMLPAQRSVAAAEIRRIADVEIGRLIELGMTAYRRVGAQAAQAPGQGLAGAERVREMTGMCAIDHEVRGA